MAPNIIDYLEAMFQFYKDVLRQFAAYKEILGIVAMLGFLFVIFHRSKK